MGARKVTPAGNDKEMADARGRLACSSADSAVRVANDKIYPERRVNPIVRFKSISVRKS